LETDGGGIDKVILNRQFAYQLKYIAAMSDIKAARSGCDSCFETSGMGLEIGLFAGGNGGDIAVVG